MQSVSALTDGLIDYAGLFPPAGLDMRAAVRNYAEYLSGADSSMLGRFVLPANRLAEFAEEAKPFLPAGDGAYPWKLAVLLGDQCELEVQKVLKFNCEHWVGSELGHAVIDTVELKINEPKKIRELKQVLPRFYGAFIEIAANPVDSDLMDAVRECGFSAKIRTGGIEQGAFPTASSVIQFLEVCLSRQVPFKATAGLHHIVCGSYPLTYEPSAAKAEMFGFINVFLAASFMFNGGSAADASMILGESDSAAFEFTDDIVTWHGKVLTATQIAAARKEFAVSFGSCSFTEPVEELKKLIQHQRKP